MFHCEIELEYMASRILQGIVYSDEFINFRRSLCYILDLDNDDTKQLQESLISKLINEDYPCLNMSAIEELYYNKNKSLINSILELVPLLENYKLKYEPLIEMETLKNIKNITDNKNINTPLKFKGWLDAVGKASAVSSNLINPLKEKLAIANKALDYLTYFYKVVNNKEKEKIDNTPIYTKYSKDFLGYLLYLQSPYYSNSSLDISTTLQLAIGAISKVYSQDDFHPFKTDECINLMKLLMYPEDYGKFEKKEEIISMSVASLFCSTYPTTANFFAMNIFDSISKNNLEDLLNFQESFAMPSGNGDLSFYLSNTGIQQ